MQIPNFHEFVLESNAIEDIHTLGGPLYDNHLAMAKYAYEEGCKRKFVTAEVLHSGLMRGVLNPKYVGKFRDIEVRVGTDLPPHPTRVPELMEQLYRGISGYILWGKSPEEEPTDPLQESLRFHYEFECIHPFVDGNGRTGRLLLNFMLTSLGEPWHIIRADDREQYYAAIREYRKTTFQG